MSRAGGVNLTKGVSRWITAHSRQSGSSWRNVFFELAKRDPSLEFFEDHSDEYLIERIGPGTVSDDREVESPGEKSEPVLVEAYIPYRIRGALEYEFRGLCHTAGDLLRPNYHGFALVELWLCEVTKNFTHAESLRDGSDYAAYVNAAWLSYKLCMKLAGTSIAPSKLPGKDEWVTIQKAAEVLKLHGADRDKFRKRVIYKRDDAKNDKLVYGDDFKVISGGGGDDFMYRFVRIRDV